MSKVMASPGRMSKGVAIFSGYVDSVSHVGDNDYGRSGDWIDVAVFGGIIRVPAIAPVEINDQIIVRGWLRNRGRAIEFVTDDIAVARTEEELAKWEQAFDASYRGTFKADINVYDKKSDIVQKSVLKYSIGFRGIGVQFRLGIDEKDYASLRVYDETVSDWHFDLIRDFRTVGEVGARQQIDSWQLANPRPIKPAARRTPTGEPSAPAK